MFKQLLVITISETLRVKRLVEQIINKSRRLRIRDANVQEDDADAMSEA